MFTFICALFLAAPAIGADTVYIVTENLTLGEISLIHYGTARKADEIARANRLRDPDFIRVGQRLILPTAPSLSKIEQQAALDEIHYRRSAEAMVSARWSEFDRQKSDSVRSAESFRDRGEKSLKARKFSEAIRELEAAHEKNPGDVSIWILELRARREGDQPDSAVALANRFKAAFPQFADLRVVEKTLGEIPKAGGPR